MAKYRKRPVEIEAVRWGPPFNERMPWLAAALETPWGTSGSIVRMLDDLHIYTLEGMMIAKPGDWIIRGVEGELYPCKPGIFAATYDAVPETPAV